MSHRGSFDDLIEEENDYEVSCILAPDKQSHRSVLLFSPTAGIDSTRKYMAIVAITHKTGSSLKS